ATASVWTPLTVPGFDAESVRLTQRLAVIQLLGAVLATVTAVQRSAYNARHYFLWPETSALIGNIAGLGFLVWGLKSYGVAAGACAWDRFRSLNRRALTRLLLLSLAVLAGIVVLGLPVLELTFGRGKFSPEQVHLLWLLLLALGGVWVGGVAGQIIAASFYAQ